MVEVVHKKALRTQISSTQDDPKSIPIVDYLQSTFQDFDQNAIVSFVKNEDPDPVPDYGCFGFNITIVGNPDSADMYCQTLKYAKDFIAHDDGSDQVSADVTTLYLLLS